MTIHDPRSLHDAGWAVTSDRGKLYDDPTTPERRAKLAAALARLPKGAAVLDHGCGRGEFTEYIAGLGFAAVGVDVSPVAIELNRRDRPEMDWRLAEIDRPLPAGDASFDAVWSSEVVEHVYDVHGVFGEYARVLKPGGMLVVTTPYHGRLKNVLLALFGFEPHFDVEWQHIRFFTKKSLAKVAADHGLRAVRWDTIGRVRWLAKSFFTTFIREPG